MCWRAICRAEEEGEDVVDSDFSIDENDEPVSDNEDEGQKKKRRLVTKAYKVFVYAMNLRFLLTFLNLFLRNRLHNKQNKNRNRNQ